MSVTLTIRDESASGEVFNEVPLEFPTETITVLDLIRERVYQEVEDFNRRDDEKVFRGLVQPTNTEQVLNGKRTEYRMQKRRKIEWRPQFDKAIEAFKNNGFLLLIDDQQAVDLEQKFTIGRDTSVSFVRLTMLVGG